MGLKNPVGFFCERLKVKTENLKVKVCAFLF